MAKMKTSTRELLRAKDEELAAAKGRIDQLNEEAAELAFLDRLAEQQATRDVELRALRAENNRLARQPEGRLDDLRTVGAGLRTPGGPEPVGDHPAVTYLKSVLLKYMAFVKVGDSKAAPLVPVIGTILGFSDEERESVTLDDGFLLSQTLGSLGFSGANGG